MLNNKYGITKVGKGYISLTKPSFRVKMALMMAIKLKVLFPEPIAELRRKDADIDSLYTRIENEQAGK